MIMGSSKDLLDWEGQSARPRLAETLRLSCPRPRCNRHAQCRKARIAAGLAGFRCRRFRLPDQYVASWTCGMPSSTQRVLLFSLFFLFLFFFFCCLFVV